MFLTVLRHMDIFVHSRADPDFFRSDFLRIPFGELFSVIRRRVFGGLFRDFSLGGLFLVKVFPKKLLGGSF